MRRLGRQKMQCQASAVAISRHMISAVAILPSLHGVPSALPHEGKMATPGSLASSRAVPEVSADLDAPADWDHAFLEASAGLDARYVNPADLDHAVLQHP